MERIGVVPREILAPKEVSLGGEVFLWLVFSFK